MTKVELRRSLLTKRLGLSTTEAVEKTNMICLKTIELLQEKTFKVVHVFLAQRNKMEIDTWQIVDAIRKEFTSVILAVPYVIPGTRQMQHHLLNQETVLTENRWGIPEPDPSGSQIDAEAIDVVLIPLLAFDKRGYRVGYGGGYYDRFLAECRPDVLKIGLSFFDPVEIIEDIDKFDIRIDYCVTPNDIWSW